MGLATAAVGAGDDLEQVAVGVLEVQAAAPVPVVDLAAPAPAGIRPVGQVPFADPAERGVKLLLADQEGVMLRGDLPAGLAEVQRDAVIGLHDEEVPEPGGGRQAEDPGQERGRPLLVAARDDGVVQLHAHTGILADAAAPRSARAPPATSLAGNWLAFWRGCPACRMIDRSPLQDAAK